MATVDLELMTSLVAVARCGTVTAAALQLGISQSALSRRLKQLEQTLEAPLLQSVGRSVALTELGQLAVEEGGALLRRFEELKRTLAERRALSAGRVRIGGGATAVAFILPNVIAQFRKTHPEVVFQLREAGSREIEEAVLNEDLELGVVTLPNRHSAIAAARLRHDRVVLVAGREDPLAGARAVAAAELRGRSFVGFESDTAMRRLIDSALLAAGVEVNVVMELRSVAAILRMVESTGSLAFVSELAVQSSGRGSPGVVAIPVRGLRIRRQLALISKAGRTLTTAAASFSQALLQAQRPTGARRR